MDLSSCRVTAKPYLCFAAPPTEWVRSLGILAFYVSHCAEVGQSAQDAVTDDGPCSPVKYCVDPAAATLPQPRKKRTRSSATFAEKYCPWGEFSGCTSGSAGRIDCHSAVAEMMMATLMAEFPSLW